MTTALISGASAAGPALAFWLRKSGFHPTLVERAPAPRPGGQAIDIRGVALTVVDRMGLLAQARAMRTTMKGVSLVDADGNETWRSEERTFSGGRFDNDDVELLKDDLTALLYGATRDDCEYIFGNSIVALNDGPDGVDVTFECGQTRRFDIVVGADGFRSNVRGLVFGHDPRFVRDMGSHLAVFSASNTLALDNWQIAHRDDTSGFLLYPVRENTELRVALGFASDASDNLRDIISQKALVARRCANMRWVILELLKAMWDAQDFYLGSMAQIVMEPWSKGRVVLLGDAACCQSPMSGQGTSLAIVGAYILAQELARAPGDYRAAFCAYENRMRPFAERNQALATMERPDGPPSDEVLNSAKNAISLD